MTKRVCVFVDGENFRHAIVDLFSNFQQREYLPANADWASLFDWIVGEVAGDGERLRTYWYVVEHLDHRPVRLPNPKDHQAEFLQIINNYESLKEEVRSLRGSELENKLNQQFQKMSQTRGSMTKRFEGWKRVHEGIAKAHKSIEFRPAGSLRHDIASNVLGPEKAVDVKLATDLITLREIYDIAVIFSGDQDYVPAVEYVKDRGKIVVNVSFKTSRNKLLPGGAARLNQKTDWCLEVPYNDLRTHLGL